MFERAEPAWFAVYVRSRHEFVADDELRKKGVKTFLPSVERMRQWKDRKKLVLFPLFPCYLFVHLSPAEDGFLNVLRSRGVVSFVSTEPGLPAVVPDEDIHALDLMLRSGEPIDIYPHLKEGMRVKIKRGPLRGAEGILNVKEGQDMFLVNVELLGRSVGVRIGADDVEQA